MVRYDVAILGLVFAHLACHAMGLSQAVVAALLARHNLYRCMHNVPLMAWNATIASNAQLWATQTGGQMTHSSTAFRSNVGGFSYLGENLYWTSVGSITNGNAPVDAWYSEISLTVNGSGLVTTWTPSAGHYTQVVWKDSVYLGCGDYSGLLVCQYGPGGNINGQFATQVKAPTKAMTQCQSPSTTQAPATPAPTTPAPTTTTKAQTTAAPTTVAATAPPASTPAPSTPVPTSSTSVTLAPTTAAATTTQAASATSAATTGAAPATTTSRTSAPTTKATTRAPTTKATTKATTKKVTTRKVTLATTTRAPTTTVALSACTGPPAVGSRQTCWSCTDSSQCAGSMYCCPYMRKCVVSGSTMCYYPIADCPNMCYDFMCNNGDCSSCSCSTVGAGKTYSWLQWANLNFNNLMSPVKTCN